MRIRATSKPATALQQALKWLERREYFSEELRARLLSAGWPEEEVALALATLTEKRLLSDERALEVSLAYRSGKKAVGRIRLQRELEQKGADPSKLSSMRADDQEERLRAKELLATKFPGTVVIPKAARFLASRGFEEDIIESVLEGLASE